MNSLAATLVTVLALIPSAAAQTDLYSTAFDTADGWSFYRGHSPTSWADVAWDVDAEPVRPMFPLYRSAPYSLNFNDDAIGLPDGSWIGGAVSPVVDLSRALGQPELRFWFAYQQEGSCNAWLTVTVRAIEESSGAVHELGCVPREGAYLNWVERTFALDRSWGRVRLEIRHWSNNAWNSNGVGTVVDDLRVVDPSGASVHCDGAPLTSGAPGAQLELSGDASVGSGTLQLLGSSFPVHTFATAFAGTEPGILPVGAGTRCIAGQGSARLSTAPTRANGAPSFTLDLGDAPLSQLAVAGTPLYVQSIFRDGATVNFSSALVFTIAP